MGRVFCLVASLAFTVSTVVAQEVRSVLEAAAAALGSSDLQTIQYSATGRAGMFGQSYSPTTDWPFTQVMSYIRTINYDAMTSEEHFVRTQGNYSTRGGGRNFPVQGEQRDAFLFNGQYAWAELGNTTISQLGETEQRRLSIVMTPHGFLKAALAATNISATKRYVREESAYTGGCCREVTVVSFTAFDKFRVNGTINERNEVENLQTWIPNPVLGDMLYEVMYRGGYEDFGGIKFPKEIDQHFGNNRVNPAHNMLALRVDEVNPNVTVAALTVPNNVRGATDRSVRIESREIAEGVWFIGGGSHNSVAVEFGDFVTVIEAPLHEARSLAVIAEVERLAPGKPIEYLVNTHHHFDHLGGIRTYAALGSAIVTHAVNRDYYDSIVFSSSPRTLEPDLFSLAPRFGSWRPYIISVGWDRAQEGGKYVIGDGTRNLEIYSIIQLDHAQDMLVAYLPEERLLVNADLWSPSPQALPRVRSREITLYENLRQLNLDVSTIVGIHGGVGEMADFERHLGPVAGTAPFVQR
jgi:glyoxylase-like metal-dependent hydrolase (beta-lactamase superfamily II)